MHKIAEIDAIVSSFGYSVVSRAAFGVPDFDVEEDGDTFEENSLLKARAIFDWAGGREAVVAEDSGLVCDALDGAPGIFSSRFSEEGTDAANNEKLLLLMKDVPPERRTARFVSVITLLAPGREPVVCRGEVEGHIAFKCEGESGFGYDPLFIPLGADVTFGCFPPEEKNRISHRARALEKLREELSR